MEKWLPWAFAIYAPIWITWAITSLLFKRRLRVVAPDVGKRFAPPLFKGDRRDSSPGAMFMFRRDYRTYGDSHLTRVGDLAWYFGWVTMILLLACGALIFLSSKGV